MNKLTKTKQKNIGEYKNKQEEKELLIGAIVILILNLVGWTALYLAYWNI